MPATIADGVKKVRQKNRIVRLTQCFICASPAITASLNVSDHQKEQGAQVSLCAQHLDELRGFFAAARLSASLWLRGEGRK